MAKSQGFFTLRRGSTKSLTFQVLDGKQITKDRVSVVKNPKTSRQADQRAKLLPAQRFMAMMRSIVDHSWENVSYGQKSLQHFLSLAMRIQPTNPMVKGQIGWYPQAYPISEGSLPSMNAVGTDGPQLIVSGLVGFSASSIPSFVNLIAGNPSLADGDQLTVIAVIQSGTSYSVVIDRVILNADNYDAQNGSFSMQNGSFGVNFGVGDDVTVSLVAEVTIYAGAVILSRRTASKWLRSSETMFCSEVGAYDWAAAVASYMAAGSELTSDWYLNAADNDTISGSEVNTGNWTPVLLARSASPGSDTTIYLGARNNLYGNYALVTTDGTPAGEVYGAGVSSGTTLAQLQLSNFAAITDSRGDSLDDANQRYAGAFGSSTLTAIDAEQPDQFLAGSVVGK